MPLISFFSLLRILCYFQTFAFLPGLGIKLPSALVSWLYCVPSNSDGEALTFNVTVFEGRSFKEVIRLNEVIGGSLNPIGLVSQ